MELPDEEKLGNKVTVLIESVRKMKISDMRKIIMLFILFIPAFVLYNLAAVGRCGRWCVIFYTSASFSVFCGAVVLALFVVNCVKKSQLEEDARQPLLEQMEVTRAREQSKWEDERKHENQEWEEKFQHQYQELLKQREVIKHTREREESKLEEERKHQNQEWEENFQHQHQEWEDKHARENKKDDWAAILVATSSSFVQIAARCS